MYQTCSQSLVLHTTYQDSCRIWQLFLQSFAKLMNVITTVLLLSSSPYSCNLTQSNHPHADYSRPSHCAERTNCSTCLSGPVLCCPALLTRSCERPQHACLQHHSLPFEIPWGFGPPWWTGHAPGAQVLQLSMEPAVE